MKTKKLEGEKIYIRKIRLSDVTAEYVRWLNNPHINQFLESRFKKWTIANSKQYVNAILHDRKYHYWAIIDKKTHNHVGNIKLGPIDLFHRCAYVGVMIGDSSSQGKGYGTESIMLVTHFAFSHLKLHSLTAGSYKDNIASIKAFQKADYKIVAVLKEHRTYKNTFTDEIILERINTT